MKSIIVTAVLAALLLPACAARAQLSPPGARVGEVHELIKAYETSSETSEGSSGSSQGHDTLIERVIGLRPDGLELEYDLAEADPEARASYWQYPVRVFKPKSGALQLLNRAELESRVDRWLKKGKMTRAACGRWIFTWNAFRIECDPQSVIATLTSFDLRPSDLREGALHREAEALAPAPLTLKAAGPEGSIFAVEMEIDPDAVRRGRAESDVAVGEIMGKPVTFEAAARARAKEKVSGTINVTFATDPAGNVKRRKRIVKLEITEPDGRVETRTATETLERRLVPGRT